MHDHKQRKKAKEMAAIRNIGTRHCERYSYARNIHASQLGGQLAKNIHGLSHVETTQTSWKSKCLLSMSLMEDFPVMAGINLCLIAFSNGSKKLEMLGIVLMTNDHF